MAFWGIEIKPGKPHLHQYDDERGRLHLSQATLGSGSSKEKAVVVCNVGDKKPIYLCSLLPKKMETCSLNIEFEEYDEVTFSVEGPHSIHLSGFFYGEKPDSDDEDDYESDSDEEGIIAPEMDMDSEDDSDFNFDEADDLTDNEMDMMPNSGVRIEEIVDEENPATEKATPAQSKKNKQGQIVVKKSNNVPEVESEDEDGFLILPSDKDKASVPVPESKQVSEVSIGKGQNGQVKRKKGKDDSEHTAKRKKDDSVTGDDPISQPENVAAVSTPETDAKKSKKKKKNKKVKETQESGDNNKNVAQKEQTTPSPTWKLGFSNSSSPHHHFSMKSSLSARKIGANLWEVQPQFNFNTNDGDRDADDGDGDGDVAVDRGGLIHHHHRRHHEKDEFEVSDQLDGESSDSDPHTPEIKTSLRRKSKKISHLPIGKNEDLQHVSSASCCSSMQVTPYACGITPSGYTLKTSTHLLKVLNRIWNLEEQHSSNVASIKALKHELDISRAQIKTLIEERKNDHKEINELKWSTHEKKKKAVQSTKDEISDTKSSLIRERKARILLESLCDEFAKGIRDYEQKVRTLQQNRGRKDENGPDRLILHVSEAWLDERVQMKCDLSENTSISDNLCCEIETFLEAKKKQSRVSRVEDDCEPSSRMVNQGVKSNTLMAKLLEARLESKLLKSRSKN